MKVTHTQDADELVTISEAARLAHVSADTLRRYGERGIITVYRTPSNHRRFRVGDVLTLNKRDANPADAA